MKKTLVITAAMAAIGVAGPAMAGKTFDETFPAATSSVEDWCSEPTKNYNACIDKASRIMITIRLSGAP